MNDNTITRKKVKGIKGRSSDAAIKLREEICLQLYEIDHNISQNEFLTKVKHELQKNNLDIPSDETLKKNLKKLGIDFKKPKKIIIEYTDFHSLGESIQKHIRQIRVSFKSYDKVLLDYDKLSKQKIDKFKYTNIVYDNKNAFLKNISNRINKEKIYENTLFNLSIILFKKGLERYIANVLDDNFLSPKPFLYIEIHDYCIKITFQYKNYNEIMDGIYKIVETYSYPD